MNNNSSRSIVILIVSLSIIYASCNKAGTLPKPTSADTTKTTTTNTTTAGTQQGKIVYLNILNYSQIATANYDGSDTTIIVNFNLNGTMYLNGGAIIKSADNKTIYFSVGSNGTADAAGHDSGIYSCNLDGSHLTEVISTHAILPLSVSTIYYSGLQGKILFLKNRLNGTIELSDIWTANLDGTNQQQINITLPDNQFYIQSLPVLVSQDGSTAFFTTSSGSIYSCRLNGGVATAVVKSTSGYYTLQGIYLQSQQEKLLYTNISGDLQTANLDGTGIQKIALTLPAATYGVGYAKISEDGKTVFFNAASQSTSAQGIYSCNIDGSNVKQVLVNNSSFHGFVIEQVLSATSF